MRPYVIINGKPSYTITGLLIQSLPPISKPKMRTKSEEIEGRDGDIITPLGFKAYDKTLNIGLYGDYNVDEVISYFAQSGTIRFSNEVDKYYNFAPYDQVDYNRLLNFKTAKVKLHIQPFKYDALETEQEITNSNTKGFIVKLNNKGNYSSRPRYTVTGSGIIRFLLNGKEVLTVTMAGETFILDSTTLNATNASGAYVNRKVVGSLEDLALPTGENELSIRGNVTKIKIKDVSRWL